MSCSLVKPLAKKLYHLSKYNARVGPAYATFTLNNSVHESLTCSPCERIIIISILNLAYKKNLRIPLATKVCHIVIICTEKKESEFYPDPITMINGNMAIITRLKSSFRTTQSRAGRPQRWGGSSIKTKNHAHRCRSSMDWKHLKNSTPSHWKITI